jgi:hypothetical protein
MVMSQFHVSLAYPCFGYVSIIAIGYKVSLLCTVIVKDKVDSKAKAYLIFASLFSFIGKSREINC